MVALVNDALDWMLALAWMRRRVLAYAVVCLLMYYPSVHNRAIATPLPVLDRQASISHATAGVQDKSLAQELQALEMTWHLMEIFFLR